MLEKGYSILEKYMRKKFKNRFLFLRMGFACEKKCAAVSLSIVLTVSGRPFYNPPPREIFFFILFFFSLSIKEKRYSAVNTIPRGIVFDSLYTRV
tara:strand:+ start:265 stop:549 length:285 start_codon:yes stop_codon:yes gene_type:complete